MGVLHHVVRDARDNGSRSHQGVEERHHLGQVRYLDTLGRSHSEKGTWGRGQQSLWLVLYRDATVVNEILMVCLVFEQENKMSKL